MTQLHRDLLFAKSGDPRARARIAVVAQLNPPLYDRACDEIGAALKERWKRRPGESEFAHRIRVGDEVIAWFSLDPEPPILVGIPWYSEG